MGSNGQEPGIVAYVQIGTTNLSRAMKFYDAIMEPLGARKLIHHPHQIGYGRKGPEFWIDSSICDEGHLLTPGNASYVGLWAGSKEVVDRFFEIALKLGSKVVSAPTNDKYTYSCQIQDLDGNRIEAWHWFANPDRVSTGSST